MTDTWKRGERKPGRPRMLTAAFVKTVRASGRYGDGRGSHGVSLLVKRMANGRLSKSWAQRIRINGKVTNIGLGAYPVIGLAQARAKALENAQAVAAGLDPRGGGVPTFAEAVGIVLDLHADQWSQRSGKAWRATLVQHAVPALGALPVDDINTGHVVGVLAPLMRDKPVMGRRVRQRISTVLKWAVAQGYRQDDPAGPAINAALPRRNGNGSTHHKALPHAQVARALAQVDATGAWWAAKACLRFLILTAARSGEARGAAWSEIDLDAREWRIPAERMKTRVEHRVPLSDAAVEVLERARAAGGGATLVFPSQRGKAMTDDALGKLVRPLGGTVHGMRSSFRDWTAESAQPRDVSEAALAHIVPGVEGAYLRTSLYKRRVSLMQEWADYLNLTALDTV